MPDARTRAKRPVGGLWWPNGRTAAQMSCAVRVRQYSHFGTPISASGRMLCRLRSCSLNGTIPLQSLRGAPTPAGLQLAVTRRRLTLPWPALYGLLQRPQLPPRRAAAPSDFAAPCGSARPCPPDRRHGRTPARRGIDRVTNNARAAANSTGTCRSRRAALARPRRLAACYPWPNGPAGTCSSIRPIVSNLTRFSMRYGVIILHQGCATGRVRRRKSHRMPWPESAAGGRTGRAALTASGWRPVDILRHTAGSAGDAKVLCHSTGAAS